MKGYAIISVTLVAACAPKPRAPSPMPSTSLQMPLEVDGYRVTDSEPVTPPFPGMMYRFRDTSAGRVSVFVYPIPDDVQRGADSSQWVIAEGAKFTLVLPVGVQRGWYDDYKLAFSDPLPLVLQSVTIPGHWAAAATRKSGVRSIELQFLYLVRGQFLKIRATVPESRWQQTNVALFVKDLVATIATH